VHYVDAVKFFEGPWRRVVLDFEVYVPHPSFAAGDVNFGVLGITFRSAGAVQDTALSVSAGGTAVGATSAGTYLGTKNGPALPWDMWVHVHADVTPGGPITIVGVSSSTSPVHRQQSARTIPGHVSLTHRRNCWRAARREPCCRNS
jgi:hypothetical protein